MGPVQGIRTRIEVHSRGIATRYGERGPEGGAAESPSHALQSLGPPGRARLCPMGPKGSIQPGVQVRVGRGGAHLGAR